MPAAKPTPRKPAKARRRDGSQKTAPPLAKHADPFVIVPKKGEPGLMMADPLKMPTPPVTKQIEHAKVLHGRGSAHKFLAANPRIGRQFNYRRAH